VVVFLIAVLLLIVLYRVKIPSVVAFLIAGFLAGPSGLGLITNEESISFFAELGVIFLLFTIGLEFSVSRILNSRRYVLIGGVVQVVSTILIWTALMHVTGMDVLHALFLGNVDLPLVNSYRDESAC
jgi:CPA2 family monovalent cation:H+ antiporter-2